MAPALLRGQNLNSRPRLLFVGAGGKGFSNIEIAAEWADIAGFCDVDSERLAKAAAKHPEARTFADFREMMASLADHADGVVVSAPDHSHYPASMAALKARKHVFVEKPLTNSLWESEQLLIGANITGVVTQMGNQGRLKRWRDVMGRWIERGLIGEPVEAQVWTNRPIWPQGKSLSFQAAPPPASLDWTLWQGSVPERPYLEKLHPFAWRGYVDYGSGAMDMGQHLLADPLHVLGLGAPESVQADLEEPQPGGFPKSSVLTYGFAERPTFKLKWLDGGREPDFPEVARGLFTRRVSNGYFIRGTGGFIVVDNDSEVGPRAVSLSGQDLSSETSEPSPAKSMIEDWINALNTGSQPLSPWSEAAPLTEVSLVGNLAQASGESLTWNRVERRSSSEAANRLIKRPYREGWEVSAADL